MYIYIRETCIKSVTLITCVSFHFTWHVDVVSFKICGRVVYTT